MTDTPTTILLWILLIPAIGALINGLLGRLYSHRIVSIVGCGAIAVSFLLSLTAAFEVFTGHHGVRLTQEVYSWISTDSLNISVTFMLDALSTIMILVVTGVGLLIHIYSIGYMAGDPLYHRYFSYLNLFIFAMLILVLGDSLPLLFVGWEGVGLCSYLLIGFWFEDPAKASAGKKAFIVNRIGDLGFLIGMFLLFAQVGHLSFDSLSGAVSGGTVSTGLATAACLFLFVGAIGKSAQIPLFIWLPDAMAGPTPVSALIHAATMVTAGVYMVARMSFLFAIAPTAGAVIALVGGFTALFAATIGIVQTDIKKVLAYSTVSQLGYMVVAVGIGAYFAGIFHLMTHAFFKACLFMGAGAVIHALGGEQDIRKMGALKNKLPWTHWTFLISTLAIAGFPPFSGFFSKDEILWKALSTTSNAGWATGWVHFTAYAMGLAGALITSFYMFRLVFLTFYGSSRLSKDVHVHHESPVMSWPLAILAGLATIGGFVNASLVGVHSFKHFLDPVLGGAQKVAVSLKDFAHSHGAEWAAAGLSVLAGVLGFLLARHIYLQNPDLAGKLRERFKLIHKVLLDKYYVDEIYEAIIIKPTHFISIKLWKKVDVAVIDTGCVNNLAGFLLRIGSVFGRIQSGNAQAYAFWIFAIMGIFLILIASAKEVF